MIATRDVLAHCPIDRPFTVAEIAHEMGIRPSRLSGHFDYMRKAGWVRNLADSKKSPFVVTEFGKQQRGPQFGDPATQVAA